MLTQLQQDTKGNIMDTFCYSPLVVGVLIHFISYFSFHFDYFSLFLVLDLKSLFLFLGLLLLVLLLIYPYSDQ